MLFRRDTTRTPKLLLIQGSLSSHSKTALLIDRAAYGLRIRGIPYEILDLSTANLDFFREGEGVCYGASTHHAVSRVKVCDGLIFSVPVYGGAVSGGIKNFISIAQQELMGKYAGLVCHSAEGNSYHASVAFKEMLATDLKIMTVQPILHAENDSFKNNEIYDEAVNDILEEMIDSLFSQLRKRAAGS